MCFKIWCMCGWTLNYNLKSDSLILWLCCGVDRRSHSACLAFINNAKPRLVSCIWAAAFHESGSRGANKQLRFVLVFSLRCYDNFYTQGQLIRPGFPCGSVPDLRVLAVQRSKCFSRKSFEITFQNFNHILLLLPFPVIITWFYVSYFWYFWKITNQQKNPH